jgi:hypothetical protein
VIRPQRSATCRRLRIGEPRFDRTTEARGPRSTDDGRAVGAALAADPKPGRASVLDRLLERGLVVSQLTIYRRAAAASDPSESDRPAAASVVVRDGPGPAIGDRSPPDGATGADRVAVASVDGRPVGRAIASGDRAVPVPEIGGRLRVNGAYSGPSTRRRRIGTGGSPARYWTASAGRRRDRESRSSHPTTGRRCGCSRARGSNRPDRSRISGSGAATGDASAIPLAPCGRSSRC